MTCRNAQARRMDGQLQALPLFAGKRVRIMAHADKAGREFFVSSTPSFSPRSPHA